MCGTVEVGEIEGATVFFTDTTGVRGAGLEDTRVSKPRIKKMAAIPHINPATRKGYNSLRIASSSASNSNDLTTIQTHPLDIELAHHVYASSMLL